MYNKPHMFANTHHCWRHYVTGPPCQPLFQISAFYWN